jgi:hypothetical protein
MGEKSEKPKENYLKIPNHILNIPGLGQGEKLLLAHVHSFGRKGCWQNNETIGRMFFRRPRTISLWISNLKKGRHILWRHPKGFYRTLWAKSHPEVQVATKLLYRGQEIPKAEIISGLAKPAPLSRKLPSECAENCGATTQKNGIPVRRKLLHTNNTTKKDINKDTSATPAPLPAGGHAPALLEDRKKDAQAEVEQFKRSFGSRRRRKSGFSPGECEQNRQKQIKALLADDARRRKTVGAEKYRKN